MAYDVKDLLCLLFATVLVVSGAVALLVYVPDRVCGDYKHAITVDKSEKIETAVSNALDCLAQRDFVPVSLSVYRSHDGTYTVRADGADRGNLIMRD